MRKVREFTFGWTGWLFCEIAAALPDWAWPYLGWTYGVSNWCYGIAFPGIPGSPMGVINNKEDGGGSGPF